MMHINNPPCLKIILQDDMFLESLIHESQRITARLGILEGTVAKEGQSGALRDAREGPTY